MYVLSCTYALSYSDKWILLNGLNRQRSSHHIHKHVSVFIPCLAVAVLGNLDPGWNRYNIVAPMFSECLALDGDL